MWYVRCRLSRLDSLVSARRERPETIERETRKHDFFRFCYTAVNSSISRCTLGCRKTELRTHSVSPLPKTEKPNTERASASIVRTRTTPGRAVGGHDRRRSRPPTRRRLGGVLFWRWRVGHPRVHLPPRTDSGVLFLHAGPRAPRRDARARFPPCQPIIHHKSSPCILKTQEAARAGRALQPIAYPTRLSVHP